MFSNEYVSNRIICALDTFDLKFAEELVRQTKNYVYGFKLGLEFFTGHGFDGIRTLKLENTPLFLDLKFHDIPNTVAGAIDAMIARYNVDMFTIHIAGGSSMMQEAIRATFNATQKYDRKRPLVLGVTQLTSLNQNDMLGYKCSMEDHVANMAVYAHKHNLDGVVCSAHEISKIRSAVADPDFKIVTPAIRPKFDAKFDDQKRIATPEFAIRSGANFLVIGRAITRSPNPVNTITKIIEEASCHTSQ